MPIPKKPLTPSSSTDIVGQDEQSEYNCDPTWNLPSPALQTSKLTRSSMFVAKDPTEDDVKRSSQAHGRRKKWNQRPSSGELTPGTFSLPPPPTRSRTIIQMQPRIEEEKRRKGAKRNELAIPDTKISSNSSGTSQKRTTRKTAHSVIEKRRRSKMNEEFDTLKEMIPACQGQSMHKLAILQAGIEYLRYLEDCVADLKSIDGPESPVEAMRKSLRRHLGEDTSSQDEMEEQESSKGQQTPETAETQSTVKRKNAWSHHRYSFDGDEAGPVSLTGSLITHSSDSQHNASRASSSGSKLEEIPITEDFRSRSASNDDVPEPMNLDFEATTALLMLNRNGKFAPEEGNRRGIKVQDLLSES